ncbi:PREDICTED: sex peptide receptor-like [Papilio xuthus]|uniref:Sex peptide receptor-like n=1 Tax=Papilio xuthus TaxID=66420 RepID=A0AAJ6ZYZ7_PAPXU|nr:PREDICTED: sex peptide receptor-like [Papilio xuthus]XP_013182068.1 PREDICTED: sex peptide receptor-like [Papilio xuthus]XP_013182069.1 PREDICTED: sex peptide receptor-like [Papilio xuthus]
MNATTDIMEAYCVPGGREFQRVYIKVHGYIALIICLLGSAANSVNIAVLSRKEMISSTNSILTALAVADLLVMLDYIPLALHIYTTIGSELHRNSYGWAVFVYFHSIFSQTFHTISIWLTITLAIWRYIAIKFPQKNRLLCNKRNTNLAIAVAYVVCPIICLPIYFAMDIQKIPNKSNNETSTIEPNETSKNNSQDLDIKYAITMTNNEDLLTAIFWIYSVFIKLIPCIVLSILSVCLILKMKSSDRRRQKLLKKSALLTNEGEKARLKEDSGGGKRAASGGGRTDRTTRMLVALLGLFLATELPQALFGLLTAIAPHLFQECYYSFGEVMDLMALVGSAVNFVLYCSMSRQFRNTFRRLARKLLPLQRRTSELGTVRKA